MVLFSLLIGLWGCSSVSTSPTGEDLQEANILAFCKAVDAFLLEIFLSEGKEGIFNQLFNDQEVFLFIPPTVAAEYDGINVIELLFARVDFDFEDPVENPQGSGPFWSQWIISLTPFDPALLEAFQNATTPEDFENLITLFHDLEDHVDTQLPGPFLANGCEWGNTAALGSQTLFYEEYGIYDWDFFPGTDRVLAVISEDDGGVGDDFIAFLDISKKSGVVVLENPDFYRLEFDALTDVILEP